MQDNQRTEGPTDLTPLSPPLPEGMENLSDAIHELNRMRAEFIDRASHEMNTPLVPIIIHVQILRDDPALNTQQRISVATIERNVGRLARLVKDLVAASQAKDEFSQSRPSLIDLGELVTYSAEFFHARCTAAGVLLRASAVGPVPAYADGDRVLQILFTLIDNALEFNAAGQAIDLVAFSEERDSVVVITDRGIGFAKEQRRHLFQPFGKMDNAKEPGFGMGLFTAKQMVEELGGSMWGASPGQGHGFTIGVTLPKHTSAPRVTRSVRPSPRTSGCSTSVWSARGRSGVSPTGVSCRTGNHA